MARLGYLHGHHRCVCGARCEDDCRCTFPAECPLCTEVAVVDDVCGACLERQVDCQGCGEAVARSRAHVVRGDWHCVTCAEGVVSCEVCR